MYATMKDGTHVLIDYFSCVDGFLTIKTGHVKGEKMKAIFGDKILSSEITIEGQKYEGYTTLEEFKEKLSNDTVTVVLSSAGNGVIDRLFKMEKEAIVTRKEVAQAKEDIEKIQEEGTETKPSEELMTLLSFITETLTDEQALEVPNYVEKWKADKEYKESERLSYTVEGETTLYKAIQNHTSQADWTPDKTRSLYMPIGKPDEGTKENPITWVSGMESEVGKYYTDEGVLYIGLEDSKIGLHGQPKDLPRYFKVAE